MKTPIRKRMKFPIRPDFLPSDPAFYRKRGFLFAIKFLLETGILYKIEGFLKRQDF